MTTNTKAMVLWSGSTDWTILLLTCSKPVSSNFIANAHKKLRILMTVLPVNSYMVASILLGSTRTDQILLSGTTPGQKRKKLFPLSPTLLKVALQMGSCWSTPTPGQGDR